MNLAKEKGAYPYFQGSALGDRQPISRIKDIQGESWIEA